MTIVGMIILTGFTLLIGRLAQIQLFDTASYSRQHINLINQSIAQRTSQFIVNNGRGILLDRTKKVKLNGDEKPALVLFPFLNDKEWPVQKLADIIHVSVSSIKASLAQAKDPFIFQPNALTLTKEQMTAINQLHITGVEALNVRQSTDSLEDSYIIGSVRQNPSSLKQRYPELLKDGEIAQDTPIGVLGLEKAYDPFLLSRNQTKLLYHISAMGDPLFDKSVRVTSKTNTEYYPLKVVTTLDTDIQQLAEKAVDDHHLKRGGVVILDAVTSDLLTMVSRPEMDPSHPFKNGNLMLEPQYPGSVFKIVTAAAAIQNNIVKEDEVFNCDQNPYGTGKGTRQLGELNFENSFYQSCNYTFGTLANRMMETNDQTLTQYAEQLGLTQKVGWTDDVFRFHSFKQVPDEGQNSIWRNNEEPYQDQEAIAQTAIGQRDVRLTPLSVANMMATISRGGEKRSVRTATEIDYNQPSGVKLTTFPKEKLKGKSLDSYTIMRLKSLLRGVVENEKGTGHRLADTQYPVAGKSGTAETDKDHTNEWFAGYFPADNPKYAMVVVDLDQHPGEHKTYDIYHDIVDGLYTLDQKSPS